MYKLGIQGVDFLICNTDLQALEASPVPNKMQLGPSLTEGRGAGSLPEIGKSAANENIDEIREYLSKDAKMVFITAGMGGGTGTGAAPVIAQVAREMGILTVGIVTVPFNFEGRKRRIQAEEGLEAMRRSVDTLLVINNERLREITGNLSFSEAFAKADDILATAAKGIAEVIEITGAINVDFNDVNTVMRNSGVAIMGSAVAEGENRALKAVEKALESPLLNDNDISGAEYVLLNITYGSKEVMMDEISEITDFIQEAAGSTADVIFGHAMDESLGEKLSVTVIATGFKSSPITGFEKEPQKTVSTLEFKKEEFTKPMDSPISNGLWSGAKEITSSQDEPFLKTKSLDENPLPQKEMEFDWTVQNSTNSTTEVSEVTRYTLEDEEAETFELDNSVAPKRVLSAEEQQLKTRERLSKIQEYTLKLKKADGLQELENEPAFKRRNVELDESVPSQENNVSRFSVSKSENGGSLNSNNSFLHDNVD
jgi:cell division protein FtsZ